MEMSPRVKKISYAYGKMPDGNYIAFVPSVEGCMTFAKTVKELDALIIDALSAIDEAIKSEEGYFDYVSLLGSTPTKTRQVKLTA